jgi:hypothetical protein
MAPIERARSFIRSLPREGLQTLLLETEDGRRYQELLAITMIRQDEAKIRGSRVIQN